MAVRVINAGSSIRLVVQPRAISSTEIVNGDLIVTYTDGTTEDAGYVARPPLIIYAINEVLANSNYIFANGSSL